ncbi:MAG TPA: serine hydrolase [Gemmatimonadaceae bacterium]|nr:serine hydrolase [Gemmatimonadaceae bacterium]
MRRPHARRRAVESVLAIGSFLAVGLLLATGLGAPPARAQATCAVARDYWPTDGWRAATPASQKVDSAMIDSALVHFEREYPALWSVMVIRHGYVVAERYFEGHDSTEIYDLRSATKSITSILVGLAIAEKGLRGLDQTVGDLFPEYFAGDDADSRKRAITVRNLLTMTSGLDWNEMVAQSYFAGKRDWVRAVLDRPMASAPGQRFIYNTGNAYLLSVAISRRMHETPLELANAKLFGPLGFKVFVPDWATDGSGVNAGGGGLRLTTRQMAKIGWLYLNHGCWDGNQVVPADWVAASTKKWSDPGPTVRGYGFLWWLSAAIPNAFSAIGYGGQYIIVMPDQDAVIAMTADPYDQGNSRHFEVAPKYLVPAMH